MNTAANSTTTAADNTYYANPYSPEAAGFYFTDMATFDAGMARLLARGVEEVEIDHVDGDDGELFRAAGISQATIGDWFELLDTIEGYQEPALFYLLDIYGYSLEEALQHLEDVYVFDGDAEQYAEEYVSDAGLLESMPESLRYYFDYKAFARDLVLNGDVHEVEYDGHTFTVSGV